MADDNLMSQEEIERLLSQAAGSSPPASKPPAAASPSTSQTQSQADIEALLKGQPDKPSLAASPPPSQTPQSPQDSGEDPHRLLAQGDIERLFEKGGRTATAPAPKAAAEPKATATPPAMPGEGYMAQGDIDFLLNQAERALEAVNSDSMPSGVVQFSLEEFAGAPASTENTTIDLIRDVELDLKIELGRTQMYLDDVLRLRKGSVVPLDKLAGDPVDIFVNGRLIARGEVLVLNDNFCVRVAELIAGAQPVAG
jgi:flagellar motor switch protein FliN/FliY